MYYTCLKCSNGFNANFTPKKSRLCSNCSFPCVPEGNRREALENAEVVIEYFIKHQGDLETWQMMEKIVNPISRVHLRTLYGKIISKKDKK